MVAKSPAAVYRAVSSHQDDRHCGRTRGSLADSGPSATFGHIGDVSGDKLIYGRPTARGGSGGSCPEHPWPGCKASTSPPPISMAFRRTLGIAATIFFR